jgi:hypothetical protein
MRAAGNPYRIPSFLRRYDEFTGADLGFGSGLIRSADAERATPR